jgi:hypothetical protein
MQHVFCEARIEFLHIVKINFRLRTVHVFTLLRNIEEKAPKRKKRDENEEE